MGSPTPSTPGGSHRGSPSSLLRKLRRAQHDSTEASSEGLRAGKPRRLHLGTGRYHAAGAFLVIVALALGGVASRTSGLAVQSAQPIVRAYDGHVPPQEAPGSGTAALQLAPRMVLSTPQTNGWLGIYARDVVFPADFPQALPCQGAMITHILIGGPAEEAGLRGATFKLQGDSSPIAQPGDVIVAIDRLGVTSADDLTYDLNLLGKPAGARVTLRIVRVRQILEVSVKLGAPDDAYPGAL